MQDTHREELSGSSPVRKDSGQAVKSSVGELAENSEAGITHQNWPELVRGARLITPASAITSELAWVCPGRQVALFS